MLKCKVCGELTTDQKDLYCPVHARKTLQKIAKQNPSYFQPLTIVTQDGIQKLSNRRFLELPTTPLTSEPPR